MSLNDIRSGVAKMNRNIFLRALGFGLNFLTCLGLLSLTWRAFGAFTNTGIATAQCAWLIGAGYTLWQLVSHLRRARSSSVAEGEPDTCVAFYRSELERQQKTLRRSAVLVPLGLSAMCVLGFVAAQQFSVLMTIRDVMIVVWVLVVPFWIYQMLELAQTCQRELDRLNASLGQ